LGREYHFSVSKDCVLALEGLNRPQENSLRGIVVSVRIPDIGHDWTPVVNDEIASAARMLYRKGGAFSLWINRQRQFFMVEGAAGKAPW
jgi:hypothetical protein